MISLLLFVGIVGAVFVGFNIGGSSAGVAWGPAVGAGLIKKTSAAALMTGFAFLGGWTVGRNVIDTLAEDLIAVSISLFAALIVMTTAASITAGLSYLGVPISLVMATVMTIAGLGWGRATRPIALEDAVRGSLRGEIGAEIALDAVTVNQDPPVAQIGEAEPQKVLEEAGDLFDQQSLARYISMWIVGPSVALALSYTYFYTGFIGG
jgi:phosphate/sulfate permease